MGTEAQQHRQRGGTMRMAASVILAPEPNPLALECYHGMASVR
jgi:hypothetical protein